MRFTKCNVGLTFGAMVAASGAAPTPAASQSTPVALVGARIHTAAGPAIENGTIVFQDGVITALGADLPPPGDAEVVDVSGMVVMPGMLDNHSHIGADSRDLNEFPIRFGPQHRIRDVLSPDDAFWKGAVKGGVTTVITGPGSGEVSSGQAIVIKTWGESIDERIVKERGGLKIAMGRKRPDQSPTTSMAVTALLRAKFIEAQEYQARWDAWEEGGREGPAPPRDLAMEAVVRVLTGEDRIRAHVHQAHDILAIIRLSQEFDFSLAIHHSTEAYKVADDIAEAGIDVIGMPLFTRIALADEVMATGTLMNEKGVRFTFHTDDPVVGSKWQRGNAGLGMRYGMTEQDALEAVTINPAAIAGVEDRLGSLEVGKDADIVVLNGTWYEVSTLVTRVYVNGMVAYDREGEVP
ncbi:MAG: amidohydrolase family protein [Gemmatimonadetes bacterium]|nr:amidohydrolase family protein [Gemmatimonadota bacterium]MYC91885.1 amidohydrolase family protein [Gemmatimonadota bacterium]